VRDSSVSIALTMMVIYLVLVIAAGQDFVQGQYSKGQNYLVWAVIQAITFAAGVFIILQGVRDRAADFTFQAVDSKLRELMGIRLSTDGNRRSSTTFNR